MRNEPIPPASGPSPEQLAAFLDGELASADRGRIAAWLADNPPVADEIEGQRRVVRLWQSHPPPEPGDAAWAAVLAGIGAKLPAALPHRSRRLLPRTLWLGAGVAAAVLAVALLPRLFSPGGGGASPLQGIAPGDGVVVHLNAGDAATPVDEPILLASQDDVSVMNVESYWQDDGQVPHIGEGDVPMIVAPQIVHPGGRDP